MAGTTETISALLAELASLFATGQLAQSITETRILNALNDLVATLSPTETTIVPVSGALTWNLATNPVAQATLSATSTTVTLVSGEAGRTYRLALIQAVGGNNAVVVSGATLLGTPPWRTAGSAVNLLTVDIVGSTLYGVVS